MVKSNGNSHINKWLYLGKQYSYPCTTEDFVCSHPSHPEMRGARQNRNITCTCSCVLPASSLHLCLASLASPCILSCIAMHTLLHRHAYSLTSPCILSFEPRSKVAHAHPRTISSINVVLCASHTVQCTVAMQARSMHRDDSNSDPSCYCSLCVVHLFLLLLLSGKIPDLPIVMLLVACCRPTEEGDALDACSLLK